MGAANQLKGSWPLIDANKLRSIRNLAEPNDEDGFFKDILGLFFQRVPTILAELDVAIQSSNSKQLERAAHAIKGSSGNLGASLMMNIAEELELMGREGRFENAASVLLDLQDTFVRTKLELEKKWL